MRCRRGARAAHHEHVLELDDEPGVDGEECESESESLSDEEQFLTELLCDDPDVLEPDAEGWSSKLPELVPHLRVLRGAFHVINMIYVPRNHAFARWFRFALSLAIFVYHAEDLKRVKVVIERKGMKWEDVLRYKRKYLNKRVRRMILRPELLVIRLKRDGQGSIRRPQNCRKPTEQQYPQRKEN